MGKNLGLAFLAGLLGGIGKAKEKDNERAHEIALRQMQFGSDKEMTPYQKEYLRILAESRDPEKKLEHDIAVEEKKQGGRKELAEVKGSIAGAITPKIEYLEGGRNSRQDKSIENQQFMVGLRGAQNQENYEVNTGVREGTESQKIRNKGATKRIEKTDFDMTNAKNAKDIKSKTDKAWLDFQQSRRYAESKGDPQKLDEAWGQNVTEMNIPTEIYDAGRKMYIRPQTPNKVDSIFSTLQQMKKERDTSNIPRN